MPIPMDRARETIHAELKAKIEAGEFEPETKLPTHHELADAYKVSRATISRVMEDLVAEGLVVTRGRLGTYVARRSTDG